MFLYLYIVYRLYILRINNNINIKNNLTIKMK